MRYGLINITVPVFNRPELTEQTLRAVRGMTPTPHTLTVVDNGSEKETQDLLIHMKKDGQIDHLFRLEKNYGVSLAANLGWRLILAPLYMKLDNDVVMHSPDWLPFVLDQMQQTACDSVWGADLNNQLHSFAHVKQKQGLIGKCSSHVSGGAIIIPKSISDTIGYWCEDYGLYGCEDGDYGVRIIASGIEQYYFDHRPFMKHLGHDGEAMKEEHGLDKAKEAQLSHLLVKSNYYLFTKGHRALKLPSLYMPTDYDGYNLTIGKNSVYEPIIEAFMHFSDVWRVHEENSQAFVNALKDFIRVHNSNCRDAFNVSELAYLKLANRIIKYRN